MSVTSSHRDIETQARLLKRYHEYLNKNYTGGVERFFSPTGALDRFQRSVMVTAQRARAHVFARDVDDAASKLESAVEGGDGVYDLASEPGAGKTSVLPFRFGSKKVVVALPTPFEAWAAFQMATGRCSLRLKGLRLGEEHSSVCYMDSYMAANMVMSEFVDYDILMVDECDSGKGVTKFLSEVKVKGKLIIRMSASHGRTSSGPSRAFEVTEDNSLPDPRNGVGEFVECVKPKLGKRTLITMPDAQSAEEVAALVPGSKLVTSRSGLECLAECIVDQSEDAVFVSDDVCARSLNLNLDVFADSQLVTEHGVTRHLTKEELYQRMGRVGRNKPGWYLSPGLATISLRESEADVLRSNIVRSLAGVDQSGPVDRHVSLTEAEGLLCASVEPITIHRFKTELPPPVSLELPTIMPPPVKERRSSKSSSNSGGGSTGSRGKVSAPGWMGWLMPNAVEEVRGKTYYVSDVVEREKVHRPSAYRGSHRRTVRHSREVAEAFGNLALAPSAPYAVQQAPKQLATYTPVTLPKSPPTVDLTQLSYQMNWPEAIRDCVERGSDLPTIVPPGNWRHTSAGGLGCDWFARLEALAVGDFTFVESELEVVCRAWNKLVAASWVRRSPGLSSRELDESRLEFCVRYFQSYYTMLMV
jgi:hypothetical protein